VKGVAFKGDDEIINGGIDKPTEWGCVQGRFIVNGTKF
jgi:hypothetical protein